MLSNPWVVRSGAGTILAEGHVPEDVGEWVRKEIGKEAARGFGYNTWVFLGPDSVLKIDPVQGRPGRFSHEHAIDQLKPMRNFVPQILDSGIHEGRTWLRQRRAPGRPAYESWPTLSADARDQLLLDLAGFIRALQPCEPVRDLLHAPDLPWPALVASQFERVYAAASEALPVDYRARIREAFESWSAALEGERAALCHGDLWFGNVIVDGAGRMTAVIDYDRLALAPPDYELDMLIRFWTYPADFVPGPFEAIYEANLDFSLLTPIVKACSGGLGGSELRARLSALEITYRLGIVGRFGWNAKSRAMIDRVLAGDWAGDAIAG